MKITRVMVLSLLLAANGLTLGGVDEAAAAYKRGDYGTALREWRLLAEQGSSEAQLNLGYMYDNGYGVSRNYNEAIKWYRKAAEQGNHRAQYNLGLMYEGGFGVPQDNVQAHMWYDIAGVAVAVIYRDDVAREMTSAQVAEAQRLASEWVGKHPGQVGEAKTQMAIR